MEPPTAGTLTQHTSPTQQSTEDEHVDAEPPKQEPSSIMDAFTCYESSSNMGGANVDSSNTPLTETFQERFARLKELVLVKRPFLREILEKRGFMNLLDYANQYVDVNLNPPILHRQQQLLSTIYEATEERFGDEIAGGVVQQLEKYYYVSTADHVGPVTHPCFLNSNLLNAIGQQTHSDPILKYLVVLPCANISLGNHTFPRGLLFHTYQKQQLQTHRLAFLPSNAHAEPVYTFRPYTAAEVQKTMNQLHAKVRDGDVPPTIGEKLQTIIHSVYAREDVLAATSFRDQAAITNFHLWKQIFTASNVRMPSLIDLDQEDIVVRLLIKYHLYQNSVINDILFNPKREPFINDFFEGIFGSFSRKNATGTYLFWARTPGSRHKQQLWRKGNSLISKDGSYSIELHPEVIQRALERRELIPGLLLNFMVISFYYGLKCLGGFNQVNYLTFMKNAYIKMNVDLGDYRSVEVCARAQTKEISDGLSIAFLGYDGGKTTLATGIDLAIYDQTDGWANIIHQSKNLTISEAIDPLMPEIYSISYEEREKDPSLSSMTEEDAMDQTGLRKKIIPCATIPE